MTPGEWGTVATLSGAVGVVITKALDLVVSRYRDRRKDQVEERQLLSEESRELRRQILEDLTRTRAEVANCQRQHDDCTKRLSAQALRIDELERLVAILRAKPKPA